MRTIVAFASVAFVAVGGLLMGGCAVRSATPGRSVQVARATPMWIERQATVADGTTWIDVTHRAVEQASPDVSAVPLPPSPTKVAAFTHVADPVARAAGLELDDLGAPPALKPAAAMPAALLPLAPLTGGAAPQCVGDHCNVPPMPDCDDDA